MSSLHSPTWRLYEGSAVTPGTLYMFGGKPDTPCGVFGWRGLVPGARGAAEGVVSCSATQLASTSSVRIPAGFVSTPKHMTFPSPIGESHAYYYAPTNPHYKSSERAPPLLVKVATSQPLSCVPGPCLDSLLGPTAHSLACVGSRRADHVRIHHILTYSAIFHV